jgi:ubiquinone/menaquinone biosynthesis C-methylase UbiE
MGVLRYNQKNFIETYIFRFKELNFVRLKTLEMERKPHKNHQWTDEHAERFVKSMEKQIYSRYKPFAKKIDKISKDFRIEKNPSIMDLACGPAFLLMEIQKKIPNALLFGVDKSEKMLSYAKNKIEKYGISGIKLKHGTAESIPLEDNSFSIVTCLNSLHDFQDPKKTLNEVYRVLKNDGIFIVKDKNPSYPIWKMKLHFYFLRFSMGKIRAKKYYKSSHHWIHPEKLELWMRELQFKVKFISKRIDYIAVGQK